METGPSLAREIYNSILRAMREGKAPEVASALEMLAEETGQNTFRYSASILRGAVHGRPAIDDRRSLRRIASFPPTRQHLAVGIVAREIAGADAPKALIEAIERRLRRKMRRQKTVESVLSAATTA